MNFRISFVDCAIVFDDVIQLNQDQINLILREAASKTLKQCRAKSYRGIKLELSSRQRGDVLRHKTTFVGGRDAKTLTKTGGIFYSKHARDAIADRMDNFANGPEPFPESLERISAIVVGSTQVDSQATWKGTSRLRYTLLAPSHERLDVVVEFEKRRKRIIIITVTHAARRPLQVPLKSHIEVKRRTPLSIRRRQGRPPRSLR